MNLGELLSELRIGVLNDRSDQTSGTSDYLWTDETLVRYINEAHRRFARRSCIIRDATTPEVTQVTLVEGQSEYALHASILSILSAKTTGAVVDLIRAGHGAFDMYRPPDNTYYDPSYFATLPAGNTLAYSTDEGLSLDDDDVNSVITLRVYPTPGADQDGTVLKLRVVRSPLTTFVATKVKDVPEIPVDFHLDMLDWAAYLALRIVDDDAGNPKRAEEFKARFEATVKEARNTVMRKLFAPAAWGFGRNGFSWGR